MPRNYLTTRRKRWVTVTSSPPRAAQQSIKPVRPALVPIVRRPRRIPKISYEYNFIANAPPTAVNTKPIVVRRFPRPRRIHVVIPPLQRRQVATNPTTIPPPKVVDFKPIFVRHVRRVPTIPVKVQIVSNRQSIVVPQSRSSTCNVIVVRTHIASYPKNRVSPRIVWSGEKRYLHNAFGIHKPTVVQVTRRKPTRPVPISIERTTYLSPANPALLQRTHQRVVNRPPAKHRVRQPIVVRTRKPVVDSSFVLRVPRRERIRSVMPRLVFSPAPTLRVPQSSSASRFVSLVRRPESLLSRQSTIIKTVGTQAIYLPSLSIVHSPIKRLRNIVRGPVIVSARHGGIKSLPRVISGTRHVDRRRSWPRPRIVPVYKWTGPKPVATPGIDGNMYDIIAASIYWLRQDPRIVAKFGDNRIANINKFVSDVEARGVDYPYVVFYEPEEVELFESKDSRDISSMIDGIYRVEVFGTGKLLTRQLSEVVGERLNDAPLTFSNGRLMYLRRSMHQYPTLESQGSGENVVVFKRLIEFEYKYERVYVPN